MANVTSQLFSDQVMMSFVIGAIFDNFKGTNISFVSLVIAREVDRVCYYSFYSQYHQLAESVRKTQKIIIEHRLNPENAELARLAETERSRLDSNLKEFKTEGAWTVKELLMPHRFVLDSDSKTFSFEPSNSRLTADPADYPSGLRTTSDMLECIGYLFSLSNRPAAIYFGDLETSPPAYRKVQASMLDGSLDLSNILINPENPEEWDFDDAAR